MKKSVINIEFIAFVFVLLILFSCEKDQKLQKGEPGTQGSKKKVTFVVSGFSRSNLPFSSALSAAPDTATHDTATRTADSLKKYIDHLYLIVAELWSYPTAYHLIDSVLQTSEQSDFGTLSTSVIPGNYSIIVLGSHGPLDLPLNKDVVGSFPVTPFATTSDIFLGEKRLEVRDSASTVPVSLRRVVGQLEVQLDDAIPAECKRLEVTVEEDARGFDLIFLADECTSVTGSFIHRVSRDIQPSDIGKTGFKISTMVLNTREKHYCDNKEYTTTKIKAFSSDGLLKEKDVNLLTFAEGVKTILRGQLFHTSNQFGLAVDTVWKTGQEFNF